MKTAIVHIGGHKTGSTSIQSSLFRSQEALLAQGIRYFIDYNREVQLLSLGLRRRALPLIKGDYPSVAVAEAASRETWKRLARTVRRQPEPFTVLSEEALMRIKAPHELARLLHRIFDRVFIVAYVRDPVSRYPSSIDQWVRGGRSTEQCVARPSLLGSVLHKLIRYEDAFGASSLIVRNFDHNNWHGGSPCSDFAHVVSRIVDAPVAMTDAGKLNDGLPASVTHALLKENDERTARELTRTSQWLVSRKSLIAEIRGFAAQLTPGKLALNGTTPLLDHLCYAFAKEVDQINTRYLIDQVAIRLPTAGRPLAAHAIRPEFDAWIGNYANARDAELVAQLKAMLERPRL
jgi:hypothetical protein